MTDPDVETIEQMMELVAINSEQPDIRHDVDWMKADAKFALQNDVDFIIQSVYKNHKEIKDLKRVLQKQIGILGADCINPDVKIMAKIENE